MGFKKLVQCPSCKFTNRFGDPKCLICKEPLPQKEEDRVVPEGLQVRQRRPAKGGARRTMKMKKTELAEPGEETEATLALPRPRSGANRKPDGPKSESKPDDAPARPKTQIAQPSTAEETSKIIAWLVCDPLPPIPLGPKPMVTVGRGEECDLCLPHKEVSRNHGLLKVRGRRGVIVYEDEGSSNGSFVNGKRVHSRVIKEGDLLTLGPYELEIRSNKDMRKGMQRQKGETTAQQLTALARVNPSAALAGKLEEVPMTEVLGGIEFNKKSGTLTVWSDDEQGELCYRDGAPLQASLGSLLDDEAVMKMIGIQRGRFSVSPSLEDGVETRMKTTITALLFEASRRIDESTSEGADGEGANGDDL